MKRIKLVFIQNNKEKRYKYEENLQMEIEDQDQISSNMSKILFLCKTFLKETDAQLHIFY